MLKAYRVEWLLVTLVWVIGAAASKRTTRREPLRNGLLHASLLALAFALVFGPWPLDRLDARFIPEKKGIELCGVVLTAIGLGIAMWARLRLGRNWSGALTTVKEDHTLIRQGPYRLVRHPIYFGFLVAMLGTAIGYGRAMCLTGLPIAILAFWTKSRMEERFMVAQFGSEYVQYQREVKAFIPGLL